MNTRESIKVIEKGKFRFVVSSMLDENPDFSFLGEYGEEEKEYCIDRHNGIMLGQTEFISTTITGEKYHGNFIVENWFADEKLTYDDNDYYNPTEEWNDDNTEVTLTGNGRIVLANSLSTNYDRNSYRYFYPPVDNYEGIEEEELIKYCIQDYKRMENYNRGNWYFMGIIVTMYYDGEEIAENSLWGIESDIGNDDREKIIDDLISECEAEAKKKSSIYLSFVEDLNNLS